MTTSAVPVELRRGTPPTSMQRALLASQVRHPTSPLQNMALLSHIDGPIDPERLSSAFARVVHASDALRSTFDRDATYVMLGDDPAPTTIETVARADSTAWAATRAATPIDLTQCAYDSVVLRHEDDTVSWYLALHHAVTDATSSMLIFDATARAYAGDDVTLPSYYEWWRSLEGGERTERARRHWSARDPAPRIGRLYRPVLRPTPASVRTSVRLGADLELTIHDRLAGDLRMISPDLGWTTLLTTVAASYLYRLTGAERFAIGLPVHNRGDVVTRELVGPLMEVFPVDIGIEPGATIRSLHDQVGRAILTTLRHARPGSAPPVADCEAVVNVITRAGHGSFGAFPARTEWVHSGASDPNHLFRMQLVAYGDGPQLLLDLNSGAVDTVHRSRAGDHVAAVLRSIVEAPDSRLDGRTICSDSELDLLHRWEVGASVDTEPADVIVRLGDALAHNDAVVLEDADVRWTGRELWARVVGTAGWLESQGVRPVAGSNRVGIEMPRSADAVVAIFATLLAGGSFVPLDPSQPAERRRTLAERAGCVVVLSELPSPSDTTDGWARAGAGEEAYLLYTSGSTGGPKGVPITRSGLTRYVEFALDAYVEPDQQPVAPLFSALTFDLTITTLFVPLLAGGRLVVVRPDGAPGLAEIARRPELTWCKATPSHLELLLRLDPCCALRTLVVGGEAFHGWVARQLWDTFPDVRIFNEYGPTEAVVGCMIHEARSADLDRGADVPIGRPAPGVRLRIVDDGSCRVPIGATGELLISHDGLTAGYLDGDDEPFVMLDGHRWYRSGDLVRLVDDETLVYHGRRDQQIKVGGIRLEPSEVERALGAHPAVRRAAVGLWSPSHTVPDRHCARCGLPSNVPGVAFDDDDVCDTCHAYERIRSQAAAYFRTPDDLRAVRDRARRDRLGTYDCLHLLSGGKDSTFALYQLVAMGFEVYAVTLDNGFISEGAKENVRRSIRDLGIDHEFLGTEVMTDIFRESLDRHSNVCNGCYKTIYNLATRRAVELGIPVIVTGLSRGQLFETRLIPQQFSEDRFDADEIDRAVLEARKVYHRVDDAPNRLLDTTVFASDDVFDRVEYVDFFRYVDVELDEMLTFLHERAPWVRPSDTGRSTNCLINAAGIHTHLTEQGYHNYAVPYAWDVRLGHKSRAEAMAELDDDLDLAAVGDMLDRVGYQPRPREVLTCWLELHDDAVEPGPGELRSFLADRLPAYALPSAFVTVAEIPVTTNGKLDVDALPGPTRVHRPGPALNVLPSTPTEAAVIEVFERLLGLEPVGVDDDFFDLGGDSLAALRMITDLSERFDRPISDVLVFTNPTPRQLALVIDAHLRHDAPGGDPAPSARPASEPPMLSIAEQALLYDQATRPDDVAYNVGHLFRIHGSVETKRLIDAVRTVVARHVPLHWTFSTPRQELGADDAIDVLVRSNAVAEEDLHSVFRRFHLQPFDLERGPLARCVVQPLTDGTVAVAIVTHFVSTDGGSFDLLWREIDDAYSGERLPDLPIDYADHAAWQRDRVAGLDLTPWTRMSLEASTVHFGEPAPASRDGYLERRIALTRGELRAGPGTTPYATLLAALGVVLRRRADGDDVAIGLTVSSRDHPAARHLVGLFLNTVPGILTVEPGATFEAIGASASELVATALTHRTVPLASIVAERRRHGLALPDVSVLLALEDWADTRLGPLRVDHEVLPTVSAVADATFFVQMHGERLRLSIEYRGSVISPDTAEELLGEFESTIGECVRRPKAVALGIERARPVDPVLRGPELPPTDRLLHDLVSEHARLHPTRHAVRVGDEAVTYAELDRRANQVANALGAAGVGPGSFVGVHARPSVDLVVGVLGTLKSGAAYVPLDPAYPEGRLRRIIAEMSMDCIVRSGEGDVLDAPIAVVPISRTRNLPDTAPAVELGADAAAYVIHTSGSTGRPKGVVVRHRNIVSSTLARSVFYPRAVQRFLLLSSFSFDSSMVGLFWTLCSGGTLVIATSEERDDVLGLAGLIQARQITHLLALPSLYRILLTEAPAARLSSLETVIVAGEVCPVDLVEAHRRACPDADLCNEYGPTEATVWSHAWIDDGSDLTDVPIGTPIPGACHAVLDELGRPVPVGEVGELFIGGAGVAAGYLDDPDATAQRFVQPGATTGHPPEGPWYRTGDLVRSDHAGCLSFVGRVDRQLKVRGHRIEPGEVEAAIRRHAGAVAADVRDVVVTSTGSGDRTDLVAFVVAGGGFEPTAARRALLDRLPTAFVPSVIHQVDSMPLLPSGKIDVEALRSVPRPARPEPDRPEPDRVVTSDDDVRSMIALWEDVIGTEGIGPDDEFFDVGGHSLAAMSILARVLRERGVNMPMATFHSSPTPRALTDQVRRALGSPDEAQRYRHLVPFPTVGQHARGTVFCVHGVGGNPLNFAELARLLQPEWHLVGIQASGVDGIGPLHTSVDELCRAYLGEILAYQAEGPYFLAGYSSGGVFAFEMAARLVGMGHDVGGVVLLDTLHPDVEPRARRPLRHLRALVRRGPRYLLDRRRAHRDARRYAALDATVEAHVAQGGVMAYELRARWIANGLRAILRGYSPPVYEGDVWLFASTTLHERYEHVGVDRGWAASATRLDVVQMPGRHDGLLDDTNVTRVAVELRARLDQAIGTRATGAEPRSHPPGPTPHRSS